MIATLREYAPGDDPRRVDWKASARRDAPVVREYQAEQGQTVLLVVDAGRLMTQLVDATPPADGRPGRSRFDAALDAALVLADVAARAGTTGYEVLTSLGARYRRAYVGGA